jgi:hypothetical protein
VFAGAGVVPWLSSRTLTAGSVSLIIVSEHHSYCIRSLANPGADRFRQHSWLRALLSRTDSS